MIQTPAEPTTRLQTSTPACTPRVTTRLYTRTNIHANIHAYAHAYTHAYTHANTHPGTRTQTCTQTRANTPPDIPTEIQTSVKNTFADITDDNTFIADIGTAFAANATRLRYEQLRIKHPGYDLQIRAAITKYHPELARLSRLTFPDTKENRTNTSIIKPEGTGNYNCAR